jgi:hypothetical protein
MKTGFLRNIPLLLKKQTIFPTKIDAPTDISEEADTFAEIDIEGEDPADVFHDIDIETCIRCDKYLQPSVCAFPNDCKDCTEYLKVYKRRIRNEQLPKFLKIVLNRGS